MSARRAQLRRLSRETGIPLVVTNDAHYINKEDARNQDVLLCIQTGKTVDDPDRMKFSSPSFISKAREEMRALPPKSRRPQTSPRRSPRAAITILSSATTTCRNISSRGETDSFAYLTRLCREGYVRRYGRDRHERDESAAPV